MGDVKNGTIRQINAYFRATDENHKFPICGKFDVAERAIRRLRRAGNSVGGFEYYSTLEVEIGNIVNDERNW